MHQDLGLVHTLDTTRTSRWASASRTARRADPLERRSDVRPARLHELGYDVDVAAARGRSSPAAERTGIAIARALKDGQQARVLVVDEPTAMLPAARG